MLAKFRESNCAASDPRSCFASLALILGKSEEQGPFPGGLGVIRCSGISWGPQCLLH